MSSQELEPTELAARLAGKAQEDEMAVSEFAGNPRIGDGVIGFHAQQAVEKWLKAVIASRGQKYDRTHDIDRLIEAVTTIGVEIPLDVDRLIALTEFAVPLRYEELLDAEPIDREMTATAVQGVGRWAASLIADAEEA